VGNIQSDVKQYLKNINLPNNVIFCGSVNREKLLELYQSSSLFVLPSIEEGLSMTIAEGMASGLPILCTTNTGGQELVEDGKLGFIVPIRDENILAEKILWCYQNREEAKEMGNQAQCRVQKCTWDAYGEKIFDIYKKIL
jgi:glycosyltransferase involved in cell wall biosynthesis